MRAELVAAVVLGVVISASATVLVLLAWREWARRREDARFREIAKRWPRG